MNGVKKLTAKQARRCNKKYNKNNATWHTHICD